MKHIIIILAIAASVSCQIYTQIQEDGYHYDRPNIDIRLNLPSNVKTQVKPSLPVKPNVAPRVEPVAPELPPVPSFIPKINLPKVIPIQPAAQPLPVKPEEKNFPDLPDIPELPPIPSFLPQINLPKVISAPQQLPVKPDVQKPAPFTVPRIDNDYLPPVTNDYLPPLSETEDLTIWEQWKKKFTKRYATAEEDHYRQTIFEDNVKFILSHNKDYEAGKSSSECGINKFTDLTTEEFILFNTGLRLKGRSAKQSPTHFYDAPYGKSNGAIDASSIDITNSGFARTSGSNPGFGSASGSFDSSRGSFGSKSGSFDSQNATFLSGFTSGSGSSSSNGADQGQFKMNIFMPSPMLEKEIKDEVDWRKEGAITPVKNQGKCASCWAFSANGALEAHNFLRKRSGPIPLSEQNLIDCVKENDGCEGGYMTNAYIYAERNPGVDTESSYPYEAKQSKCRFNRANVGGECMSHMEIQIGNEKALEQAVATVGPVAAGIDGGQRSFQFYKSGYYFEPKCEQDVNHAVLIVGYGKTETGEEYWICKNSWDTDWGEEGYIRMAKNKNNNCGITNLASYPIV